MASKFEVKEQVRRIISKHGSQIILHDVTSVDTGGSWTRLESAEGYVIVNPENVLAYIVKGEIVR
jgi:hypothetical protein